MNNRSNTIIKKLSGGAAGAVCALLCGGSAWADSLSSTITAPIKAGLSEVYTLLTAIVLPIAVIVIAICAIKIIWGNQRSAEEGKSAIIRIVVALALVYLAPLLVSTISSWFQSYSTQGGIFS